jgi:hypothetical protein
MKDGFWFYLIVELIFVLTAINFARVYKRKRARKDLITLIAVTFAGVFTILIYFFPNGPHGFNKLLWITSICVIGVIVLIGIFNSELIKLFGTSTKKRK